MFRSAKTTASLLTYLCTATTHHQAAAFQRFLPVPAFFIVSSTPSSSSPLTSSTFFSTPEGRYFSSSSSSSAIATANISILSKTEESIMEQQDSSNNNNNNNSKKTPERQDNSIVQRLADRQAEWQALSLSAKADLLQEISQRLSQLPVDEYVSRLGKDDAIMMGFDVGAADQGGEAHYEATQSAFLYVAVMQSVVQKLHHAYQVAAGRQAPAKLEIKSCNNSTTTVKTHPVFLAEKMGPLANIQTHVWLKQPNSASSNVQPYQVQATLDQNKKDGCMVVLGAGNHCFLSAVDCLHGLFVENSVVLLKHHPLRGSQHDGIVRYILQPVLDRGYFDTVLDQGDVAYTQALVHHKATSKVHLTGGKATHDAIVWGDSKDRAHQPPKLQATMTSELGCVTPWIVAPTTTPWTDAQMDHQVQHLYGALYSNAGANCNSPKVIVLGRDWPQSTLFVEKLKEQLASKPPPVAYYPGARDRWNKFRQEYPAALELGDAVATKDNRPLLPNATVLPWLVIDNVPVDLSTGEGRAKAQTEYAFRNEPFAPVVTIAYVDTLPTAVKLANDYMFGSLSCTVIASQDSDEVEQAIADLKYGAIAVNSWSAICYIPSCGSIWGAYPGESLDSVESGIGHIHNYFFLPNIEKAVVRSPMIDDIHTPPYPHGEFEAKRNEGLALAKFLLRPGPWSLVNLILTAKLGVQPVGLVKKIRQRMAAPFAFFWGRRQSSSKRQE